MPFDLQPRRVLVVDDDEDIRDALSDTLEADGYGVDMAANGLEALQKLRTSASSPGVILLDLMMPTMDGPSFRAAQRSDPAIASIPVIIVSANARVERAAAELGAAASIPKPFKVETLLEIVARFCRAH